MLQKIKFISSNPLKRLLKVQNEWMRQEFCRMALSLLGLLSFCKVYCFCIGYRVSGILETKKLK